MSRETEETMAIVRDLEVIAREQGKEMVRSEVVAWLRSHLDSVDYVAQADLLRILGVKIL